MTINLSDFPEYRALIERLDALSEEVRQLKASLPEYVGQQEAERLTGLSRTTLFRERKRLGSLIKWKSDRGPKYLRSSLLAHNQSRVIGGS